MSDQDIAEHLSTTEQACLIHLLNYPDADLSQFDEQVVDQLIVKGLVDRVPLLAFPVLPPQTCYRLTSQGRAVLKAVMNEN
jgi:hypothetical protein